MCWEQQRALLKTPGLGCCSCLGLQMAVVTRWVQLKVKRMVVQTQLVHLKVLLKDFVTGWVQQKVQQMVELKVWVLLRVQQMAVETRH